jgi:hypothetical protein
VFRPSGRAGTAPPASLRMSRQEAELQRVLEEEIVREMQREQALAEVGSPGAVRGQSKGALGLGFRCCWTPRLRGLGGNHQ